MSKNSAHEFVPWTPINKIMHMDEEQKKKNKGLKMTSFVEN